MLRFIFLIKDKLCTFILLFIWMNIIRFVVLIRKQETLIKNKIL